MEVRKKPGAKSEKDCLVRIGQYLADESRHRATKSLCQHKKSCHRAGPGKSPECRRRARKSRSGARDSELFCVLRITKFVTIFYYNF